jgi:lysine N6-hydroxylase
MMIETLDAAGIGIGPFNLSVAALLEPVKGMRARFLERRPSFEWQTGMMLPGTRMQTSFLKDLVTPVDPTSRFSFLAYLVDTGRFYRFINAEFSRVLRVEFADYMRWAAERIDTLSFGANVTSVSFDGRHFKLDCERGDSMLARDLVVATGLTPYVPSWAQRHLGKTCLHSGEYMHSNPSLEGKRVLVIGGGQSGVELFLNVVAGSNGSASQVTLVSRRPNLEPLDETAFVNEYFSPEYVQQFRRLPATRRALIVASQKLASDGISPDTLRELSQLLYESDFLRDQRRAYGILTHREVRAMSSTGSAFRVEMHNGFDLAHESVTADVVILATGYQHKLPACLDPIAGMFSRDSHGQLELRKDYNAVWAGPDTNRIYVQNAGRHSHGIADPQLSLAAWRAGVIVNSLIGRDLYNTDAANTPLQWQSSTRTAQDHVALLPLVARAARAPSA